MSDEFRTVSSENWFGRMWDSIVGVLIGLVLILVSLVVLFWNEGRAVHTAKSLEEGASSVVTVKPDSVDSKNEGKLVAMTGDVSTDEMVTNPTFKVGAKAISVRAKVEMYQWKEDKQSRTEKKLGGGTETITDYKYKQEWSDQALDSAQFKERAGHDNPPLRYKSEVNNAKAAKLGGFEFPDALITKIDKDEPLQVTDMMVESLPSDVRGQARLDAGRLYLGKDPGAPKVGDVRVTFASVKSPVTVTVIGQQKGSTLVPFKAKAGDEILMLKLGKETAASMFKAAADANGTLTWILRGAGFLFLGVGFYLVFRPLEVFADLVPWIGSILGAGIFLFALLISAFLSAVTIAIAWVFYRPLFAIGLFVGAGLVIGLLIAVSRKSSKATS